MEYDRNHIETKLSGYIRQECLPAGSNEILDFDRNLFEAGIVDSAGLISFISYIEREFGMSIPDDDLLPENFVSIARIAGYIRAHLQVQPA